MTQATKGVQLAQQGGESIDQIRDGTKRVQTVVNDISGALVEQSSAAKQISSSVGEIVQMSAETSSTLNQTVEAARRLRDLSAALQESVRRFTGV